MNRNNSLISNGLVMWGVIFNPHIPLTYPSQTPHIIPHIGILVCLLILVYLVSQPSHLQGPTISRMWRVVWVVCEGYVRGYFNPSHRQIVWYQQVIMIHVRDQHFLTKNLFFLRQKKFLLKPNSYCQTGKILLPNWEKFTGLQGNFYWPTGKILLPHEEILTASPESFCSHVWEFLPPDVGKSFARRGNKMSLINDGVHEGQPKQRMHNENRQSNIAILSS